MSDVLNDLRRRNFSTDCKGFTLIREKKPDENNFITKPENISLISEMSVAGTRPEDPSRCSRNLAFVKRIREKTKISMPNLNQSPLPTLVWIMLLLCMSQGLADGKALKNGSTCDAGKVWMEIGRHFTCTNCDIDRYYIPRLVICSPCGPHSTNNIRSLRRTCKDPRVEPTTSPVNVVPPTIQITEPSSTETAPKVSKKHNKTVTLQETKENEDVKVIMEKPIGDEQKDIYDAKDKPNDKKTSNADSKQKTIDSEDTKNPIDAVGIASWTVVGIFGLMGLIAAIGLIMNKIIK